MKFSEITKKFIDHGRRLKTIFVATCSSAGEPNCAPKMLINVARSGAVYYLDYAFAKSYANLKVNPRISLSFMDDVEFLGYRLSGAAAILRPGREFDRAKGEWESRVIRYEAERLINRLKGKYSTRESELLLPENFVIVKFIADEAALVKPDRAIRSLKGTG